ncbi:DUF4221 domain-containing protein [Aquiflexum gelatinilyticum]|uniref:DUF4221 domain-containing protein n=1 Tax=Aquiflexum gelatinilyticum TaxID=2961943 RepID=UPI002168E0C2|nr:DUF4221 domain-containing protein [Aquiflexum gelatinilyticum]MCS4436123.1 DUF4221 domain-containing protein [Aquiflexum gelatinilyticum]
MLKNSFSYILLFVVSITLFSCGEKASDEIYVGKLEELVAGDLLVKKDSLTKNIEVKQVIHHQGIDFIISLADRERTIQYYSIQTGEKVKEIKLPFDGPDSFKGYIGLLIAEGMDSLTIVNMDGWFYDYYQGNRLKEERIDSKLEFPNTYYSSMYHGRRNNFTKVSESQYQISVVPLVAPSSNFSGKTKAFDKIEEWIITFDSKENKAGVQNLIFPFGYRSDFVEDHLSYPPIVEFIDNKNYVLFPYSDSVFVMSDFKIVSSKKLNSGEDFNFIGSEYIVRGGYAFNELKKEASSHLDFLYDKYRNIFIRISKINESGAGETTRERTKHHLLSIYDADLDPISEYTFDFGPGSKLENYFIASDGFYLNKPDQVSEDQYEFYRLDLSKIKKP